MEGILTSENIALAVSETEEFFKKQSVDEKEAKKVILGVEETLLRFRDEFSEKQEFELNLGKAFGKVKVVIKVYERMYDPFAKNEESEDTNIMMRSALASMGVLPVWRYSRGVNSITYVINKKTIPEWTNLIIAIALAVICGVLLKQAPEHVVDIVYGDIFEPLLSVFMNLLSAIASPMIFFALVWGIYSIGDASTFSVLGKKLALRYFSYITFFTLFIGGISMFFFKFEKGGTIDGSGLKEVYQMVLDIVPGNIFTPFAEGNTLQIVFLGIIIGVAMIMIGEKTQTVALIAEQLNYLVQIIMNFISKLVPFFVFGSLLGIILSNDLTGILSSYKFVLSYIFACAFILITCVLLISIKLKVNALTFIKKVLPTFIIGVTTASSAAAFSENLDTCINKLGIKKSFSNFGVPFNQVIFKPGASILYFLMAIFTAEVYSVPTSLSWFASAFLMCIILGIATPPVPGGTLASIAVLFAQLQLPETGIALALALNVILDFVGTPTNLVSAQSMLALSAKNFNLIDESILKKQ